MKKNLLIIVCAGDYSNSDVYERVLSYIIRKDYIGGYGFPLPPEKESILSEFYRCERISDYDSDRKLWHFTISLPGLKTATLLRLAETITQVFAGKYDLLYGVDLEPGHYHIHFAVNTYGCFPNAPLLTPPLFHSCLLEIKHLLSTQYPNRQVEILYKEEGRIYV